MSHELDPIDAGWSAADLDPAELVTDEWIRANTRAGRAPSPVRHLAARATQLLNPRTPMRLSRQGLTRDQLRRCAARTGYPYVEAWSGHNKGSMRGVWGAMVHHTGTPWSTPGDYPTLRVVRDGRPGLENSLCAFGLGRSGTIYLISEKLSWHAGAGNWNGMTDGNGYTVGIEAESDGKNWTPEERDAYPRLVASILIEIDQDDRYTTRHASYAQPAGRKVDASGLDMDLFWRQVYGYLANPASIHRDYGQTPPPAPDGTYTVAAGDTLYSIAVRLGTTVEQIKAWNGLATDTIGIGQVLRIGTGAPTPPPPPPPPAPPARPPVLGWHLPAGHCLGNVKSPSAKVHGGHRTADSAATKALVRNVQQWLIYRGCVPGVPSAQWATSGWADSVWGDPTDAAMARFNSRPPRQPNLTQCWADDYRRLTA
jgi:hypothetical protein